MVKNLPAMQETGVWSLSPEEPLEKEMATHFIILAWRVPMERGAKQVTVRGVSKSRTWLSAFHSTSLHLEHSNSCLSSPIRSIIYWSFLTMFWWVSDLGLKRISMQSFSELTVSDSWFLFLVSEMDPNPEKESLHGLDCGPRTSKPSCAIHLWENSFR